MIFMLTNFYFTFVYEVPTFSTSFYEAKANCQAQILHAFATLDFPTLPNLVGCGLWQLNCCCQRPPQTRRQHSQRSSSGDVPEAAWGLQGTTETRFSSNLCGGRDRGRVGFMWSESERLRRKCQFTALVSVGWGRQHCQRHENKHNVLRPVTHIHTDHRNQSKVGIFSPVLKLLDIAKRAELIKCPT